MPNDPSLTYRTGLLTRASTKDDEHVPGSIGKAAWILEDAVFGNTCEVYPDDREARRFHLKVQYSEKCYEWALLGLVVLSFLEAPTWCSRHTNGWAWIDGSERCQAPDNAMIFLSGLTYVPPNWGIIIELACMAVILVKFVMQHIREVRYFAPLFSEERREENKEPVRYLEYWEIRFGMTIVFLGFLDCAVFAIFRNHTRIVLVTRSGLLMLLPSVRNLTRVAIEVIFDVSFIMMFLGGSILMFAWVTVTLFHDYRNRNVEGEKIDEGFTSFPTSVYSMFLASVTEESFIEIFKPTFTEFRITGMLWLFFLVLVHLLLLNLVLDTLVAGYATVSEKNIETSARNQAAGVLKAFAECSSKSEDPEGDMVVSKQGFLQLLAELGNSPYLGSINGEIANAFFNAVDEDGSGEIDQKEFIDICQVMNYDFWVTRYDSPMKKRFPAIWNSKAHIWFREFYHKDSNGIMSLNFENFMNIILVVNFGLIILESVYDLHDWDEPQLLDSLELCFSIVYVFELGLKLTVISWPQYWSFSTNQFDFWTTIILLFNSALSSYPALDSIFHVDSRYANMLRVLRLLRVLKTIKNLEEVRFLSSSIMRIVMLSRDIMTLLGVIIFIFSQISVQLFGGLLYVGNPKLEGTEYAENKWYVLNYNDLPMAFAVYFVSLLVEFEPVFAEVISRVAPFSLEWMITFFYYVCACAVVFELVQAFTIETFVELYQKHAEEKREKAHKEKHVGKEHTHHSDGEESEGEEIFPRYRKAEKFFKKKGWRLHYCFVQSRTEKWDDALEKAFDEEMEQAMEMEELERQSSSSDAHHAGHHDHHGHAEHHEHHNAQHGHGHAAHQQASPKCAASAVMDKRCSHESEDGKGKARAPLNKYMLKERQATYRSEASCG